MTVKRPHELRIGATAGRWSAQMHGEGQEDIGWQHRWGQVRAHKALIGRAPFAAMRFRPGRLEECSVMRELMHQGHQEGVRI